MKRAWDVQVASNWWLSLGFHIDHADPSLTLHLPGVIVYAGRCKQPGFRTLRQASNNDTPTLVRAPVETVVSGRHNAQELDE